ncbi:hypothetical protein [Alteribacter keqinensis]|uniref:Uncharacterized protein n=1 Tax=Alteribacter keqinensis TaxID=2483800 RepID=A0A3M7TXY3_9BACI|nr:hypothetical protein [Alteribacter keqinensis]RNA70460.1 hypothetical protein EBO34_11220 [Alteribacter keqinensis]
MPYFRIIITGFAKLLSKVFSMATLTFFGRIPSKDNSKVSLMGLLSLYWLYVFLSVLFPDLAEMFIPFVPDDDTIVRITSIAIFIILPLVVGFISTRMENRSEDKMLVKQVLMGYPYAFTLGLLSTLLVIVIPIIKIPNFLKFHEQAQFAIMIRKGKYEDVLEDIQSILDKHNIKSEVHSPNKFIWTCFITLSYVLERIYNRELSKKMKYITVEVEGKEVEITLHATDISMIGPRKQVYYIKHTLSEELEPANLYFSWDDTIQDMEDDIRELKRKFDDGEEVTSESITEISDRLRNTPLTNEDWNAVRRQIYKLEREYYKQLYHNEKKDKSDEKQL